jgi:hypothetical protein
MVVLHLYFHSTHYEYVWKYKELSPVTWGDLAMAFHSRLSQLSSSDFNALDIKTCKVLGIYDPRSHYIYPMNEIISFPYYLPPSHHLRSEEDGFFQEKKIYYLLLSGPIYSFVMNHTNLFYDLIVNYLIETDDLVRRFSQCYRSHHDLSRSSSSTSSSLQYAAGGGGGSSGALKDLFYFLCTSKILKRYLVSDHLWNQIDFPSRNESITMLFPSNACGQPAFSSSSSSSSTLAPALHFQMSWEGQGSQGTEAEYWSDHQEEHGLTRYLTYK